MKDLDKLFSDKLYDHKTAPPVDLWGQLDAGLQAEARQKRKALYWRIAAAVSLLLVAGTLFWLNVDKYESENIARAQPPQKTLPQQKARPVDESELALQERPVQIKNEPESIPKQAKASKPGPRREKASVQPFDNNDAVPQVAASLEDPGGSHIEENMAELNTLDPEPLKMESQQLAVLDTEVLYHPVAVTIIYKPDEQSIDDAEPLGANNTLELLAELKNGGISFTQIRSAKSELLAKVFTKIDNGISR